MNIKLEALKRMEAALKNLGVSYRLELEDTVLTNIEAPKIKRQMDRFKAYNVVERLQAAAPGEVVKIDLIPDTDVDVPALQSNICAKACRLYGAGKYITQASMTGVDVVVLP